MKQFRTGTILVMILLACSTGFAYFHFQEKEHLGLAAEVVRQKWQKACPDAAKLQTGDLIFRHGRGAISNLLRSCSRRDSRYSHAGIISVQRGKVFVYHAIGGEENPSSKLRKDPLSVFCNPDEAHAFGLYRLDFSKDQLREMESVADAYYKSGLPFDTKFDLDTNDKMYCSEFVYKVITQVARNEKYISLTTFAGKKFVACDDLYLNPHVRPVYSYVY